MSDAPSLPSSHPQADAVLYEGYLLYPYRASAAKNQARCVCVLMPCRWSEDVRRGAVVDPDRVPARAGGLHHRPGHGPFRTCRPRPVEVVDLDAGTFNEVLALPVDGSELVPWDEATEHEVTVEALLARLLAGELVTPFERPGGRRARAGPHGGRQAGRADGPRLLAGPGGGPAVGRAPGRGPTA